MYFFGPLENLCCEKIINLPSRLQQGSELYRDVVCQVKHSDIQINHILLSSLSLLTAEVWSVCWGGHWNCSNDVIFTIHDTLKIQDFNICQSLLQKWMKRNNRVEQIKQYSIGYQTQHRMYAVFCSQWLCYPSLAVPVDTMQMYLMMVGLLFEA